MKNKNCLWIQVVLLCCLLLGGSAVLRAQEGLQIATLFDKYKEQKNVTYVELNGEILESYGMKAYRSLVFKDVSPYRKEVQRCLDADRQNRAKTTQEVVKDGVLWSFYCQLKPVDGNHRYIIFKVGKQLAATLIYIEGKLEEKELMEILYKK